MNLKRIVSSLCAAAVMATTALSDFPLQLSEFSHAYAETTNYNYTYSPSPLKMPVKVKADSTLECGTAFDIVVPGVDYGKTTVAELRTLYSGITVSGFSFENSSVKGMTAEHLRTSISVLSGTTAEDYNGWYAVTDTETLDFAAMTSEHDDKVVQAISFHIYMTNEDILSLGLAKRDVVYLNYDTANYNFYEYAFPDFPIEMTVSINSEGVAECGAATHIGIPDVEYGTTTIDELRTLYSGITLTGFSLENSSVEGMTTDDLHTMLVLSGGTGYDVWCIENDTNSLSFADISSDDGAKVVQDTHLYISLDSETIEKFGLKEGDKVTLNPEISSWSANFSFDENTGVLTWDNHPDVSYSSYAIMVNEEETPLTWVFSVKGSTPSINIPLNLGYYSYVNNKTFDGYANISVICMENNIQSSDSFIYNYDGCDVNESLMVPSNLKIDKSTVTWDNCDGALGYMMQITGNINKVFISSLGNSYSGIWNVLSKWDLPFGKYELIVSAIDINGDRSEWSQPLILYYNGTGSNYYEYALPPQTIDMMVSFYFESPSNRACSKSFDIEIPDVTYGVTTVGELKNKFEGIKVNGFEFSGSTVEGMTADDIETSIVVVTGSTNTENAVVDTDTMCFEQELANVSYLDVVQSVRFTVSVKDESFDKLGLQIGDHFNLTYGSTWAANFSYDENTGLLSWDNCPAITDEFKYYKLYAYTKSENVEKTYMIGYGATYGALKPGNSILLSLSTASLNNPSDKFGDLKIYVTSIDDKYTSSDSFAFSYDGCDVKENIAVPSNTTLNGTTFSWNRADSEVGYMVCLSGNDTVWYIPYGTETDISPLKLLSDRNAAFGDYELSVAAIDINGDRSEWSYPVALKYYGDPDKCYEYSFPEDSIEMTVASSEESESGKICSKSFDIEIPDVTYGVTTVGELKNKFEGIKVNGFEFSGSTVEGMTADDIETSIVVVTGSSNTEYAVVDTDTMCFEQELANVSYLDVVQSVRFTVSVKDESFDKLGLQIGDHFNLTYGSTWAANFSYDENTGLLSWDSYNNMSNHGYAVIVNEEENPLGYGFTYNGSVPSINIPLKLAIYSYQYNISLTGDVRISVICMENNIQSSDSFIYNYDGCDEKENIAVPSNLRLNNTMVDWDESDGAVGYLMRFSGNDTELYSTSKYSVCTDVFEVLRIYKKPFGKYEFSVAAVDINGDRSKWSQPIEIVYSDTNTFTYSENYDGTLTITGGVIVDGDVVIPSEIDGKKVTEIGMNAFSALNNSTANNIRTLVIPEGIKKLHWYSFNTCENLESVSLPDSLEFIDSWVFERCAKLETIHVPANVSEIKGGAFAQNKTMTSITCDPANENFISVDGVLFTKDMQALVAYPGGIKGKYTVPASVHHIGDAAFYGAYGLDAVEILGDLDFIGFEAFALCELLEDVIINEGVTYVGYWAFRGCEGIKMLTVPQSVTNIGDRAFGFWNYDTLYEDFKLRGYKDSAAYFYALRHNIPFICIGETDNNPFEKGNSIDSEVETNPEGDTEGKITTITTTVPFNMKDKSEAGVGLDISDVKVKAKEIYDEEGIARAEAALGTDLSANSKYNLVDITMTLGEKDISAGYDGLVEVVINIPPAHRDKTFYCYRILDNGTKELIPGKQTEDSYIVYLEHFSTYAFVSGEEHTHTYSTNWSNDKDNHWHECPCGDKSDVAKHTPGEWITDREATASENGQRHKECTVCGYITETEIINSPKAEVVAHGLTLRDNIGVTFYMTLSDDVVNDKNAYLEFALPNNSAVRITVSEAGRKQVNGNNCYAFSCSVAAAEMTDIITGRLFMGDGSKVTEFTYSVATYANYILEHRDNEEFAKAAPVVEAMLNYGAAAQKYFRQSTEMNFTKPDVSANDLAGYKYSVIDNDAAIDFNGHTISLKSKVTAKLYFSGKEFVASDFTVKQNGVQTDASRLSVASDSNGTYLAIAGICTDELSDAFEITVGGITIRNYSAFSYVKDAIDSETEALSDVAAALYAYGIAAADYANAA